MNEERISEQEFLIACKLDKKVGIDIIQVFCSY